MPVVAVSKKPLIIRDGDTGKDVTIFVRQITRKESVEYHEITNKLSEAGEGKDAGQMFELLSRAIMMRVCDESKQAMDVLLDKIGVDQYDDLLTDINALFARSDSEKKQTSQRSTASSPSASEGSASKTSEGLPSVNGETLFQSPALAKSGAN